MKKLFTEDRGMAVLAGCFLTVLIYIAYALVTFVSAVAGFSLGIIIILVFISTVFLTVQLADEAERRKHERQRHLADVSL